ncbi:MAG: phosphate/phosphite/phosphonate ABC transporter substrate-binding protein [Phycisphaerales bacterium]|nr:phosphate/phosphite/phosphonate ABC transporter substrate-binding protein [Phycisphaerales bacterium]
MFQPTLACVCLVAVGSLVAQVPTAPATPAPAPALKQVDLTFGVYATDLPTVVYRQFLPMLEVVQAELGKSLECPASVELRIFKTYEAALDALVQGTVDFVRFGPSSYLLAKERRPEISLLAMEDNDGEKIFQGVIVVRANSPIKTLADLRGRKFAFGDENSTIGRYLAQLQLVNAGLAASDLAGHAFLGRHDKVFTAVEVGDFDAGAVKENTYDKMNKKGTLRELVRFDNVTKPWVARAGLDPRVAAGLREVLIGMQDRTTLKDVGITGFRSVKDADYESIRLAMRAAEKFAAPAQGKPARPAPGK